VPECPLASENDEIKTNKGIRGDTPPLPLGFSAGLQTDSAARRFAVCGAPDKLNDFKAKKSALTWEEVSALFNISCCV
jgi:hypothetical protein